MEQYTKRPSGVTAISAVVLYPVNSGGNVVMTYVGVSSPFLSSQPKVVVALSSSLSTQTAGSFGYAQAPGRVLRTALGRCALTAACIKPKNEDAI